MLCRPPISTLFPYTTLFRSDQVSLRGLQWRRQSFATHLSPSHVCIIHIIIIDDSRSRVMQFWHGDVVRRVALGQEDRKSTRLNSSHLGISYAVFCLKKKRKT